MSEDRSTPDNPDSGTEPWRDEPADDEAEGLAMEPAPAEVVDEERGIDLSGPGSNEPSDLYAQDTLDERLREEEPDPTSASMPPFREPGVAAPGVRVAGAPDEGGRDVTKDEVAGAVDSATDLSAEEEAVHVEGEE